MDEVFGSGQFQNEIVWGYGDRGKPPEGAYPRKHETLFFYTKREKNIFNRQFLEMSDDEIVEQYPEIDENGKTFLLVV